MVGLKFGPHRFLLYYQTAFKIAVGVLMSAKLAARYEGVHPSKWAGIAKASRSIPPSEPLHRRYRRTREVPNFTKWKVAFDENLVILTFDQEVVRMHYSDAFELYGWIRAAAANAKRWAGDTSKQRTVRAVLTDAEENDKLIYVGG